MPTDDPRERPKVQMTPVAAGVPGKGCGPTGGSHGEENGKGDCFFHLTPSAVSQQHANPEPGLGLTQGMSAHLISPPKFTLLETPLKAHELEGLEKWLSSE